MARFISVRVEVEVLDDTEAEIRQLAQDLADTAKASLGETPGVRKVIHAAGVVRRA